MNLGEQLAINRSKEKDRIWASKLTGVAKEAKEFLDATFLAIKFDIEKGYSISPICVPGSLNYAKNFRTVSEEQYRFWKIFTNFQNELLKEGLSVRIEKMPPNDLNREGGFDHYIHINPSL